MKTKIINALRTKYQRFGLSNEAIDRIASAKEKTVTSEDQIETAIADAETMGLIATELQKSADVERRKASDLQKSFDEYKEKHPDTTPDPKIKENEDEKEPEWAKKLREQNEQILSRQKAEDAARAQRETLATIETKLKEAGCINAGVLKGVLKGFALGEKEEIDSAVERLKGEYNTACKEIFGESGVPGFGGNAFSDPKDAVERKNQHLRDQGLLPATE